VHKGVDGVAAAVMGYADAAAKVIGVYSVDQINHIGLEQDRFVIVAKDGTPFTV